ncbi:aldehyde dehydrogenase family protein [Pseudaminobacter arsenicus]|uniref:aldehyde dehydrogenase (NAD(+)) n=1 Tax=Borborobacter arsenicus TaxID=1851146 RepID=A0A432VBJ1_9HYPH|nr:aldehyde dehydrogenase family protein [Pseudaminobacter arsenicus]RUM99505.1 aldehyde dehydrogenase family protein [Pseudaminobacter arsenicus]
MRTHQFFIDGKWIAPESSAKKAIVNPATGEEFATVAMAGAADVVKAVSAARKAFASFSQTTRDDRIDLLSRVLVAYERRRDDIAKAMMDECGFPRELAYGAQAGIGAAHLTKMIEVLRTFPFAEAKGSTMVWREPIGVCALITPWNWPMNQITCKVAPALAAGCTMVLKPSELSPLNALIFAEVMEEAGIPAGVFNLLNGDGPNCGAHLSSHPDVDMVSFTGSTRGGIAVAKAAADTVKRVHQELGGKSPFIVLPDADFDKAVGDAVTGCYLNAGQSCNAPTRLLVERLRLSRAEEVARAIAEKQKVGMPDDVGTVLGPVISEAQHSRIQDLIQSGIDEKAKLVLGGTGLPEGVNRGYFVRPTVFSDVTSDMTLFRQEVFGPVLSIVAYDSVDHAIELANDTEYGLAGYVHGRDLDAARKVAARIRAGNVYLNSPAWDASAPFGGYKMSGNGREYAEYGLNDFLEIKGVVGYEAA